MGGVSFALGSFQMAPSMSKWPFLFSFGVCWEMWYSLSPLKSFQENHFWPSSNWGRGEGYKLFVTQLPSSPPWQLVECIIPAKISCLYHPISTIGMINWGRKKITFTYLNNKPNLYFCGCDKDKGVIKQLRLYHFRLQYFRTYLFSQCSSPKSLLDNKSRVFLWPPMFPITLLSFSFSFL